MGSLKDQIYENNEEKFNKTLADILGISRAELSQLEYDETELTNNDDYVYAVEYRFFDSSPKEILDKISGLDADNSITIDAGMLGFYS